MLLFLVAREKMVGNLPAPGIVFPPPHVELFIRSEHQNCFQPNGDGCTGKGILCVEGGGKIMAIKIL